MDGSRRATDAEVGRWRDDGWVLLESLIATEAIDRAAADLAHHFPSAEEYHRDPVAARAAWIGDPARKPQVFTWPPDGPGFRPEQHDWAAELPFGGSGALQRLVVLASVVDFVERALGTRDIRLYQAQVSAKFAGATNFEQPMHTDRNHSWLPAPEDGRQWQVQLFCYLTDVDEGNAPTHLVPRRDSQGRATIAPLYMPRQDAELYAAERAAPGSRGSVLAYRNDVFHRGVDLTRAGAVRFILGTAFRRADADWVGYHAWQSRATAPEWTAFIEQSSPRELELLGFPPPGHAVWTPGLLDVTAARYPNLDLTPWREALASR